MKENVGPEDQAMRAVIGPFLLSAGYLILGGRNGRAIGLISMIAGALVLDSAITRTCPLNDLLGLDTTEPAGPH